MDDLLGSTVVGPAHEVGVWRGPARWPWLRRIAHGAGFSNHWDEARLISHLAPGPEPVAPAPLRDARGTSTERRLAGDSLALWWLPRAHGP
jgi:hypothetical protein